ncbi:MAG: hypothetical protein KDI68_03030 [Gammaproteobacteria bacterium]|nr:hypothetical protein [Gammaproteobacteria bacterium]
MEPHRLVVGALGWDHAAWQGGFYPDDLPEDWRLGYYANEFSGVLLPESIWRQLNAAVCRAWCDDVGELFRFYLQTAVEGTTTGLPAQLQQAFGRHWGGCCSDSVLLLGDDMPWDLRQLRARIEQLLAAPEVEVAPPALFICGDPPDLARMRQARLLADML